MRDGRSTDAPAEPDAFASANWNSYRSAWERAVDYANVEDFRFHDLRHTYVSWLVQAGRPLVEVRDLLGHKTVAMTMRYAHLAPEQLRKAAEAVGGVLGGVLSGVSPEADAVLAAPSGL